MKLALWTTKFPELTETFIESEIRFLKQHYPNLSINTLKPATRGDLKVNYFSYWDIRNIGAFMVFVLTALPTMVRIIMDLFKGFDNCPRPYERIKSFLLLPTACRAALLLNRAGTTHLMSHWSNVPSTVAWVCQRLYGWPHVLVLHGENLSKVWPLLKIKCSEASKVITCTRFNKERIEKELDHINVSFHSHGVDIPVIPEKANKSDVLQGLSVGRLVPTKGLMFLLEALSALLETGVAFKWTIIGEGPQENELKSYCKKNNLENKVSFLGALEYDKVLPFYISHDVFVLPLQKADDGDSDGLPNVILEAMSYGCPIISTSCAAVEEAVQDQKTGLIVTWGNTNELMEAIVKIKEDVNFANKITQEGKKFVSLFFDKKICHQELLKTLRPIFEKSLL